MSIFKKKLTVNEAINKAHTSENAMLIDCRTKDEFNHGHVAGAVNIPLDKITEDRILRRFPDKKLLSISSAVIISDRKKRSKPLRNWAIKMPSSVETWKSIMEC